MHNFQIETTSHAISEAATSQVCPSRSARPACDASDLWEMHLGKFHIWEVSTEKIVTWDVAPWKMPIG